MTRQEATDILDGRNATATLAQQIEANHEWYGPGGFADQDKLASGSLLPPDQPPYAPPSIAAITPVDSMNPAIFGSRYMIMLENYDSYIGIGINSPNLASWTRVKELYGSYLKKYSEGTTLEMPPLGPWYRVPISLDKFAAGFYSSAHGINAPYGLVQAAVVNPFDFAAAMERKRAALNNRGVSLGGQLQQPSETATQ